jgi:hypothetical protein
LGYLWIGVTMALGAACSGDNPAGGSGFSIEGSWRLGLGLSEYVVALNESGGNVNGTGTNTYTESYDSAGVTRLRERTVSATVSGTMRGDSVFLTFGTANSQLRFNGAFANANTISGVLPQIQNAGALMIRR